MYLILASSIVLVQMQAAVRTASLSSETPGARLRMSLFYTCVATLLNMVSHLWQTCRTAGMMKSTKLVTICHLSHLARLRRHQTLQAHARKTKNPALDYLRFVLEFPRTANNIVHLLLKFQGQIKVVMVPWKFGATILGMMLSGTIGLVGPTTLITTHRHRTGMNTELCCRCAGITCIVPYNCMPRRGKGAEGPASFFGRVFILPLPPHCFVFEYYRCEVLSRSFGLHAAFCLAALLTRYTLHVHIV